MWTVNDAIFDDFHVHLEHFSHMKSGESANSEHATAPRLAYMIALDMSTGAEVVESLRQWLVRVHRHVQRYHTHVGAETSKHAKDTNVAYLSQARANQGAVLSHIHEETEGAGAPVPLLPDSPAAQSFGVPIIVCACKCDIMYQDKSESAEVGETRDARYFQALQGQLRSLCLEAGAALVNTSSEYSGDATNGGSSSSRNEKIHALSQYIAHRLFPEHVAMRPLLAIVGVADYSFVPAGLDSAKAIFENTGHKGAERVLLAACESSSAAEGQSELPVPTEAGAGGAVAASAEDEHAWLGDLQAYIAQATTGALPPRASTAELAIASEVLAFPAQSEKTSNQSSGASAPASASRHRRSAPSPEAAQEVTDFFIQLLNAS